MKNFEDTQLFKKIGKGKLMCIFVSPHLDDAVFSAGGLISALSENNKSFMIINVFTKASPPPYTISIKKFLKSCGYADADVLYKDRHSEDEKIFKSLKTRVIDFEMVDALWRRKRPGRLGTIIMKVIPEAGYVYPVYRLTIARGLVSRHDKQLIKLLTDRLEGIIKKYKNSVLFLPLAIGKHTDHLIVRDVGKNLKVPKVYWADYPYLKNNDIDKKFLKENGLNIYELGIQKEKKEKLVNMYLTQIKAIFGTNKEKIKMKEYYFA